MKYAKKAKYEKDKASLEIDTGGSTDNVDDFSNSNDSNRSNSSSSGGDNNRDKESTSEISAKDATERETKGIVIKPQVQAGIDKMLEKGRRYFGSSGASLTHEMYGEGDSGFGHKVVDIGLTGERKTTEMLKQWIKDKPNVVLVDSVHLKAKDKSDSKQVADGKDTDHVLIMGNTIAIIDTKAWKKNYNYKIAPNKRVLRGNRNFRGGVMGASGAVYIWRSFFPDSDRVFAYVCIQADGASVSYNAEWKKSPYKLVAKNKLFDSLDWAYDKAGGKDVELNSEIVAKVVVSAVKPRDRLAEVLNEQRLTL